MKLLKRTLSLVLALTMVLALIIVPSVANAATQSDDDFEIQATTLKDLGILQYNIDNPDAVMTRAQFVDMAIRTYIDDITSVEVAYTFSDVIPNYEFRDTIEAAANSGIVRGDGNGIFGVNENITTKAAITIMLRILGYEDYIKWHGNYNDIYLAEASKIKLTTGVNLSQENMTFRDAVKLVYNAIDIAPYEIAAISEDSISFEKDAKATLISQRLNIYKVNGILTDNRFLSLNGSAPTEKGYVKIDGKLFKVGSSRADDFIGYNVLAYCKIGVNEPYGTVLHIEDDNSKITEIDDESYAGYSNGKLSYYKKNKSQGSISVDPTAIIIYNNGLVKGGQFSDDIFDISNGKITVIERSLNGNTVIVIESYNDMVVDRVVTTDDHILILDKFDSANNVYIEDEEMFTVIDENGKVISIEDIKPGNTISAATSFDGTCGRLLVSTKSVSQAHVTSAGDDCVVIKTYNEPAHTYDEIEYKYTQQFKLLNDSDKIVIPTSEYTVYFNVFGDVAYMDLEKDISDFYAYIKAWASADKAFNHKLKLKVFKTDGKFGEYELAEGVVIDGIKCKGKSVDELCDLLGLNSDDKTRLVFISLNFDGKIREIDTCPADTPERLADYELYKTDREAPDTMYKVDPGLAYAGNSTSYPSTYKHFTNLIGAFNTGIVLRPDTVIMGIPLDSDNDKRYKILTTASFVNSRWYDVDAYCRDDSSIGVDVVIFHYYSHYSNDPALRVKAGNGEYATKAFERSTDADTAFVSKLAKGKDPETGDIVDVITLMVLRTGASTVYYLDEPDLVEGIKQGDIVRWFTLGGSIAYLEKLYDLPTETIDPNPRDIKWTSGSMVIPSYFIKNDGNLLSDSSGGANDTNLPQFMLARSVILNKTDRHISYVTYDNYLNGKTDRRYQMFASCNSAKVYVYDSRNSKLNKASLSDIVTDKDGNVLNSTRVLVQAKTQVTQAIIILK